MPHEAVPLAARSEIVAADGTLLARLAQENRAPVPLSAIPIVMREAIVAAEDARFYAHRGIDAGAVARAAIVDVASGGPRQGGSTLTQQLAKMMYFPAGHRTFGRKLAEARMALRLERAHTKGEILAMYLNRAYFGAGAYGVEAAAETFFGVHAPVLALAQAATLAGLVQAPTSLDPFFAPGAARARRNHVLARMAVLGMIPPERARAAASGPLGLVTRRAPMDTPTAPYFVEYVKRQVLSDPAFGATEADRAQALLRGGMRIRSTLDLRMQKIAERAVAQALPLPGDPEAAVVALDPHTGAVKALVGGMNFARDQFDLATQGRRQPGSTFKPFVLAAALEEGMDDSMRFDSTPGALRFGSGALWKVGNYDGVGHGSLTLRDAMVRSVNAVYARLGLEIGPERVAGIAQRMGITSPLGTNPAIALGGLRVGVSPLEMASAYGTMAAQGRQVPPTGIANARDAHGRIVFDVAARSSTQAISREVAWSLTSVLRDVIRFGTGRRAAIGRPAAGKTGTTEDYHDAWFVGFTPDLVTAVWVGYRRGQRSLRSVHGAHVVGGTIPARIWSAFMSGALHGVQPQDFVAPVATIVLVRLGEGGTCLAAQNQPGVLTPIDTTKIPTRDCGIAPASPSATPSATVVPTASPSPRATPSPKRSPSPSPSASPSASPTPHP